MTSFDGLDRRLTARLDERAAPRAPDGLSEAITDEVAGTGQRPAWATLERWIPMETRAQFGAVPRAVVVFALLVLLTLVMATAIAIGANTTVKVPEPFGAAANGLIAFANDGDIWVVEPDGTELRRVTDSPEQERGPSWSRDGTKLSYWVEPQGGPYDLYVVDADGTDPVLVATSEGEVTGQAWSADGSEIMYSACSNPTSGACASRIIVARVDGGGTSQVGDPELDARGPALSPDGITVAFGGGQEANDDLYLMDWDGSDVRRVEAQLSGGGWAFAQQTWHPSGLRLVTHDGSAQSIWMIEFDDALEPISIESLRSGAFWPVYAPDGSALRWALNTAPLEVFVPDDEDASVVFSDLADSDWSPDGELLVGITRDGLTIKDRAGETVRSLGPADATVPAWQRVAG